MQLLHELLYLFTIAIFVLLSLSLCALAIGFMLAYGKTLGYSAGISRMHKTRLDQLSKENDNDYEPTP